MRKTILATTTAFLMLSATVSIISCKKETVTPPPVVTKSLYERLGGINAITAVIDKFLTNVVADNAINARFGTANATALRLHLIDQVCEAAGGPCKYKGKNMKDAHTSATNPGANISMITEAEFNALVGDLVSALDFYQVPTTEKNELLAVLGPMKTDIVGNP
jgi:hemoglobin